MSFPARRGQRVYRPRFERTEEMFELAADAEMFQRSIAAAPAGLPVPEEPPERPEAVGQAVGDDLV
jgi:hypothetical protein